LYYGVMGLLSGDPKHEVDTVSGRILIAGFTVFGLVILTSYTASLAGMLVLSNQLKTSIVSLNDVISSRGNLCMRQTMVKQFTQHFPEFDEFKIVAYPDSRQCTADCPEEGGTLCVPAHSRGCVPGRSGSFVIDSEDMVLNDLDNGGCVATLLFQDSWAKKALNQVHCNKTEVQNLYGIANGMPIREDIAEAMSYAIAVASTSYKREFELPNRRKFLPPPFSCKNADAQSGDLQMMGKAQLLGPALISAICTTCALLIWWISPALHVDFSHIPGLSADTELHQKLRKSSTSELIQLAKDAAVEAEARDMINRETALDQIDSAINKLPNTKQLIALIMEWRSSGESQKILGLKRLPLASLLHFAHTCPPEDWQETWKEKKGHAQGCFGREVEVDEAWQWDDLVDACMNAKEPKKSLISLLMHTYDTDHSGFITQAEVLEMVHSASRLGVANDTSTAQDLPSSTPSKKKEEIEFGDNGEATFENPIDNGDM